MGPMRIRFVKLCRPFARRLCAAIALAAATACRAPAPSGPPAPSDPIDAAIAQFAPVEIAADTASLPANERAALAAMVKAAQIVDGLFLEQVWAGNPAMLTALAADRS